MNVNLKHTLFKNLYAEVLLIYEEHDNSVSEGVPNGILRVKKLSSSSNCDDLYNIKNKFILQIFYKVGKKHN